MALFNNPSAIGNLLNDRARGRFQCTGFLESSQNSNVIPKSGPYKKYENNVQRNNLALDAATDIR